MMKPVKNSRKPVKQAKEKVDFKLEFHASKVPTKGWEKLVVTMVAMETGRIAGKTGKAMAKNGSCAWREAVYETAELWCGEEGRKGSKRKEMYKLVVVSMASSTTVKLGEAMINVAEFTMALLPVPLSLPLLNCTFGTILHVTIQRINPPSLHHQRPKTIPSAEEPPPPPALTTSDLSVGLHNASDNAYWHADKSSDDWVPPRNSTDSVDIPPTPGGSESGFHCRDGTADELMSPSSSISSCQESNGFQCYIGGTNLNRRSLSNGDSRDVEGHGSHSNELTEENMMRLISQLKQANDKSRSQDLRIAELEDMIVQLELKISEKNTNSDMLQELRERLKECEVSYESKLAGSRTLVDDLNSSVVILRTKNARLEREMQSLDQHTYDLSKDIESLTLENQQQKMELLSLQEQRSEIESLKSEVVEHQKEKVLIASQQGQLRKEMRSLDRHISELLEEIETLKSDNNELKAEIQRFQQEKFDFSNEIECLKSSNDEHEKEKVLIASQQGQLRKEMQSLDRHNSELVKEIKALKSENNELKSEIQSFQQQSSDLLKEIECLRSENEKQEKEKVLVASQAKEVGTKTECETLQRVNELEAMIKEKDNAIATLKEQLAHVQYRAIAAAEDALQSMESLKTEKLNIEKERSSLLEARKDSEAIKAQLENLNASLQEKLRMEEEKSSQLSQNHDKEKQMKEFSNSGYDQILKELDSLRKHTHSLQEQNDFLQKQNALLSQQETELLTKLSLQNSLQNELNNVKEEKMELANALAKFNAASADDNILKRIVNLEMELAEVLEVNNMYKRQLQSAFAQQQNVHAAALENMGSAEQVLKDLADLKRKNALLDDELRDMKERYFNMSLQYAEVEAEREELVMTIRTLKGARKLTHYKSSNF